MARIMGMLGQLFKEMKSGMRLQSSLDSLYNSDKVENHIHVSRMGYLEKDLLSGLSELSTLSWFVITPSV